MSNRQPRRLCLRRPGHGTRSSARRGSAARLPPARRRACRAAARRSETAVGIRQVFRRAGRTVRSTPIRTGANRPRHDASSGSIVPRHRVHLRLDVLDQRRSADSMSLPTSATTAPQALHAAGRRGAGSAQLAWSRLHSEIRHACSRCRQTPRDGRGSGSSGCSSVLPIRSPDLALTVSSSWNQRLMPRFCQRTRLKRQHALGVPARMPAISREGRRR